MHSIIPINEIQRSVDDIRKNNPGIRIVFTNGIFDILHQGHVAYLEEAKALGDLLILGLNSDDSSRRLKGNDRPYVDQDDRAFILSRLESVDIISIFEDDTPINLIKHIKPDVLVKGGDYNLSEIVGRDLVEGYGGKVCTIPFIIGKSTTNLINRIRSENGV